MMKKRKKERKNNIQISKGTNAFAEERGGEKAVGVGREVVEAPLDVRPGGDGGGGASLLGSDELEALEGVGGGGLGAVEAPGGGGTNGEAGGGGESLELLGDMGEDAGGGATEGAGAGPGGRLVGGGVMEGLLGEESEFGVFLAARRLNTVDGNRVVSDVEGDFDV